MNQRKRILVIRFGALGDLMMCRQAFHEIRAAHKDAEIALLTTPPFEKFARSMPWFDTVIAAERAPVWQIHKWAALMAWLYRFAPKRVYDLQGKFRQSIIFWLLGGSAWGPEWSGAAPGCSHPRLWPPAPGMHFVDFLAAQLRRAGVPQSSATDLAWLDDPSFATRMLQSPSHSWEGLGVGGELASPRDLSNSETFCKTFPAGPPPAPPASGRGDVLVLPERFALLIPGCSPKLMHKRWPAEKYAELAKQLKDRGIASIAIGTGAEADTIAALRRDAPDVIDLSGKTDLYQIAALARRAVCAVGNDTGPLHLAAAVGCPTLAVLSGHTDPVWSAPYGARTAWVKSDPIDGVSVGEVFLALTALLDRKN